METARETVHIEHEGFPDGLIINADEFDAKTQTLFGAEGTTKKSAAKSAPSVKTEAPASAPATEPDAPVTSTDAPKSIAEQLAALKYKELGALARAVKIAAMQPTQQLIAALVPFVESGKLKIDGTK